MQSNAINPTTVKKFAIIFTMVLLACSAPKTLDSYARCDANADSHIDMSEFETNYLHNKYFDKWTKGAFINYEQFYKTMFLILDDNGDENISNSEFAPYMNRFSFGAISDVFQDWDLNRDKGIDLTEFLTSAAKNRLGELWDASSDKKLTESELAKGMFDVADINKDNKVNEIEYNIWKVSR